jgi:glutamine synthetase
MTARAITCSRPINNNRCATRWPAAWSCCRTACRSSRRTTTPSAVLGGTVNAATRASWGFEDRDACVRIPESDPRNLRIEHRLASADANPYLVLAAILAGLEHGLEAKRDPIAPLNDDRTSGADFPWICSMPCAPCNITR